MAPDNAGVAAVKAKTDLLPAAGPPSAADYTPARAALLNSLDALISSRATDAGVWAAETRTLTAAPSVIKSIQQGEIAMNGTPTTVYATISPVNLSKTVATFQGSSCNEASVIGRVAARVKMFNANTVEATRGTSGGDIYVNFTVVEFT